MLIYIDVDSKHDDSIPIVHLTKSCLFSGIHCIFGHGWMSRMLVDPHAPPTSRCNGPCSNLEAFAKAFGIKKGDGMYLDPTKRARMWW